MSAIIFIGPTYCPPDISCPHKVTVIMSRSRGKCKGHSEYMKVTKYVKVSEDLEKLIIPAELPYWDSLSLSI